jgi:trypsin
MSDGTYHDYNQQEDGHRSLVVGGHDVANPYDGMVWSGVQGEGWGCGGAMIHPNMFVTAAHCESAFKSQGGAYVGATKQDGSDGTFRKLHKLVPHPKHDYPDNDIMIVVLKPEKDYSIQSKKKEYFELNRNANFPAVGSSITSIGFGLTKDPTGDDDDVELAKILQEVEVDVWDFPSCRQTFEEYEDVALDEDLVLCMGTVEGGRDACDSDSGSPLFVRMPDPGNDGNTNGPLLLVGVINDGIGCGRPNRPAYNARISSYVKWIDYTICQWSDSDSAPSYCLQYPYNDGADSDGHHIVCSNGVSYDAFVGSVILAFLTGMISTWMIGQHQKQRKRSHYQRLQPVNIVDINDGIDCGKLHHHHRGYSDSSKFYDDDEEMTAATAEPSPALSTFSHKH